MLLAACGDDGGATTTATSSTSTGTGGASGTGGATTSTGGAAAGGGGGGMGFTSLGASTFEAQTSIAADDAGNVVVVWRATFVDTDTTSVGYAASHDGGKSFSAPKYLEAPGGRLAINPVVTAGKTGAVTLAFIGNRLTGNPDQHVYVSRFDASTDAFGAPVVASDDGSSTTRVFDALSIAVDAADDVLLTWADFSTATAALTFARSSDGVAFTRQTITNDATFGNLAYLCVDPAVAGAKLHVVHLGPNQTLVVHESADGGQQWSLGATLAADSVVFQAPTCVARGGDVFIAYAAGTVAFSNMFESQGDRVALLASHDGGASFGQPVVVVEEPPNQYLYPRIALAPNGHLEITYYEGVVGQDATFSHASSALGTTWTRAPIVPTGTFTIDRSLASWLGAYTGVVVPGSTGLAAFTENALGKTHVGFAEIALP